MGRLNTAAVLATIGYGCLLSLSALSFWSPLSLVPSVVSSEAPSFYLVEHFGLVLSFVIIILGCFGDAKRVSNVLFDITFVLMVVGYALSANSLGGAFDLPSTVLSIGALCTGLGSGFGLICWMQVFEHFTMSAAIKIMAGGSALAAIPTLIISYLQTINPMSFSSLVIILLLISLVLLVKALHERPSTDANLEKPANSTEPQRVSCELRQIVRSSALVIPCIVALSLFQPLLDASGLNTGLTSLQKTLLYQGGNCVGAIAVYVICRTNEWHIDITHIFLLVAPIFVTVCLLFPIVSESYWFIFSFVSMVLFSLLSLSVMFYCLQFSRQLGASLLLVYGVFGICLYSPGLIGMAAANIAVLIFGSSKLAMSTMLLIVAIGCAILARLIFKQRKTHEFAKETGELAEVNSNEANQDNANQNTVSAIPQARPAEASQEFGESCVLIASHFDLTAREKEILEMLAHGRNVPFIADALSLSSHTVRGYVKSIYARTNVHSRQELIDLVEQWPSF